MLFAEELSLRADLTVRCPHFALSTAIPARNGHLGSKGSSMSWPGTLGGRNPTPPWTSYHLQRIETVREYVLVSQDRVRVEHFARQSDGQWLYSVYDDPSQTVRLASVEAAVTVADL